MINLDSDNYRGIQINTEPSVIQWRNFFGMTCGGSTPECSGVFYLNSDIGRFEGDRWDNVNVVVTKEKIQISLYRSCFEVNMQLQTDSQSGVVSLMTQLKNTDTQEHTIYACLPRVPLCGNNYRVYSQYSGWCAENQGLWTPIHAGNLVLTNSAGRSTESATPFACIQHTDTGRSVSIHVLPVGDWIIRARHIAGHRNSTVVLEMGLSDESLHLRIDAGEVIDLPELLLFGFDGEIEKSAEQIQRYLISRFEPKQLPSPIYNTWFFDFDVLQIDRLIEQAHSAKSVGCKTFVVDAGWFGQGLDWENQVGCWQECTTNAFGGRMLEFANYIRSLGMDFGLWMEPERFCKNLPLFTERPEWFISSNAQYGIFDLSRDDVINYLANEVTRLVQTYDLRWMKIDFNTDMLRDLTGSNFYRYYQGEKKLYNEIRRRNPQCSFEGCAGGGMRTDIANVLGTCFHGHFISDTVHPLEILRMRQNIMLRLLPQYTGSWAVLCEIPLRNSTYTNHDWRNRTKCICAGDAWWEHTVDYSLDFVLTANLMGQYGFSGDLSLLSETSKQKIMQANLFQKKYQRFLARSICHSLTKICSLNDISGWTIIEYENLDAQGSVIFAFRCVDDAESMFVYPKGINKNVDYRVLVNGENVGLICGKELCKNGILISCPTRYEARIIEILPI